MQNLKSAGSLLLENHTALNCAGGKNLDFVEIEKDHSFLMCYLAEIGLHLQIYVEENEHRQVPLPNGLKNLTTTPCLE